METTLTEAELEVGLREALERVRGGERVVIKRDGEPIATLVPTTPPRGVTLREIIDRVGDLKMPGDGFADDLEAIHAAQGRARIPEWPD